MVLFGCGQPPLKPRQPTPGAFHFKVESFNVKFDEDKNAATIATVGAADAEIVCLQETGAGWADVLKQTYAEQYPYQLHHSDPHPTGSLTVLSKWPITSLGVQQDANGWHPAWHLSVDTPGGMLRVLDVHLRPIFSGESNAVTSYLELSTDHLQQIESFNPAMQDPTTLVVGDFNEGPDGRAVKALEKQGFEDALPLFRPGQQTWRFPSLAGQFDAAIDHVMFDPRLQPLNAWVLVQGESDHLPVIAEFELPARSPSGN
jgi:endonuclease/exonuclease/phosphatase (EEP) superfamily protein YafD